MKIYLSLITLILIATAISGQRIDQNTQAQYLGKNLLKELEKNIELPSSFYSLRSDGDAVISVTIDKSGNLQMPDCLANSQERYCPGSIHSIDLLRYSWKPALRDGISMDKQYTIVFRYKVNGPIHEDFIKKVDNRIKKEKIEKALELINIGIKYNSYNYKYFLKRAEIYTILGEGIKATRDNERALSLADNILAVVDLNFKVVSKMAIVSSRDLRRTALNN